MMLEDLNVCYDKLQKIYGDSSLNSIYGGGCTNNPDICLVFMNPTGRNIASNSNWNGIRYPWIGTKNVWDLFYRLNFIGEEIINKIKSIKGSEWTSKFAIDVYEEVINNRVYITNLGKCTQVDARALPDSVYYEYLEFLFKEIEIVNPKIVILFGNQVSSIVLGEKISVSTCRKKLFERNINDKLYKFYSVYYPVGNGRFNMDKSIEDIKWIIDKEINDLDIKVVKS